VLLIRGHLKVAATRGHGVLGALIVRSGLGMTGCAGKRRIWQSWSPSTKCHFGKNTSTAFARLSVFDGERRSTDPQGEIGVRIGASVLTFAEQSGATL
jgi:hypothetical protein